MKTILTLDVGTTSVKACLFDDSFHLLSVSIEEYSLLTPSKGHVEISADAYWKACIRGIKKVVSSTKKAQRNISAIALTTQGETLIPVDAKGAPLANAIVWLDARAECQAAVLRSQFSTQQFYATTGIPQMESTCPAAKVLWIKDNQPEVFAQTHKFLLLLDYLLYQLTGRFATDRCIVSSTGYYDINNDCYWNDMLSAMGIGAEKFPEAIAAGSIAGTLLLPIACDLGIAPGCIIVPCGMDQASSAIGAGNITDGIVTGTTGTALVIAATSSSPDYTNPTRVNIMRHAVPGKFLILPYNATAGIILKWFKDGFCQQEIAQSQVTGQPVYDLLGELAAAIPVASDGLLVFPHFAGKLVPETDNSTKGVFFGVTLGMKKGHFVRAIMESVAYMLRENIGMLLSMGMEVNEIRALGGGAKSELWLQIFANVCKKRIITMETDESTSLGAALLASVVAGWFVNLQDACSFVHTAKAFHPDERVTKVYDTGYTRYQGLYNRLKGFFEI